jgi:peptidoglycan L-alanyl-D-glutamate endopeptidase CwlK
MAYSLSSRSKTRLEGVHPFIIDTINEALKNAPDDFGIPMYGGLRTSADQKKLYDKGRTPESIAKGEKPVTYVDGIKKQSRHQIKDSGYGEAFDVYIYDHFTNRASWNVERLTALAIHIIKCSEAVKDNNKDYKDLVLTWGGNWKKFKDYPHFQIEKI